MRRFLPLALVAAIFAVVAVAQAAPPTVTLSTPSGQTANPVTITGKAGSNPGDAFQVTVYVYNGDQAAGEPIFSTFTFVDEGTREFSAKVDMTLPNGVYSARASQTNSEQELGLSNVIVFRIGAPPVQTATPTPTATATPTVSPVPQAAPLVAATTPTPAATTYVCASRRDFVKHVPRPSKGKNLKVTATLNGEPYTFTVTRKFVLLRLDLRGLPKDTYTLKVTLKYTRPDGRRVTKNSVSRVDYHTCTPKPVSR